ncbi:MAG: HAMP domain-containing sensor histidine kinase [Caldilineaceae bacterium]
MSVEAVRRDAQAVLAYGAIVLEETTPVDAGFALLAMLQKVGALPIYLGAPDVPQRVREPFEWGAVDFVYKDTDGFYLFILPQVVHKCVRFQTALFEHKETIATLTEQNQLLAQQVEDLAAFSDSVAHDLKNPITHFLSFADYLREHHASLSAVEITGYMDVILRQSRKMHEIVDVLLLLARVRMADNLEVSPLNMATIVDNALARLSLEIREANAHVDLPEQFPRTLGYAPWVESVWVNYLSNGIKYGGESPTLTVGTARENSAQVRFWVTDSGQGLTNEEQALLFHPFPRIRQPKGKRGQGLGLSIVKRIVEQLNGRVGVESKPGEGSCFYFTLPSV